MAIQMTNKQDDNSNWQSVLKPDTGKVVKRKPNLQLIPQSIYLKRKKQWENLFEGFTSLRGITYVTSPSFLLEIFTEMGYEKVDLLIGDGLADTYKESLSGHLGLIEHLYDRITEGSLRVRSSKAKIHTKLYILESEEKTRIICGSPNLSFTAAGSRQREYAWYVDVHANDPLGEDMLLQVNADYNEHLKESDLVEFMEDLIEMRQKSNNPTDVDFKLWSSSSEDQEAKIVRTIMSDIKTQAFEHDDDAQEIVKINLPKNTPKKTKNHLMKTYGAKISSGMATMPRGRILEHTESIGVPLMEINPHNGNVKLSINGTVKNIETSDDIKDLHQGLEDIENYIRLVDRAVCHHPDAMKMNLMETVLYTLSAPFANESMQSRWDSNSVNRRGPKHLVVYGDGHNGKTTLFRFMGHLLTGRSVEPISGKGLAKDNWQALIDHAKSMETVMPILVDDIKSRAIGGNAATLEQILKTYWENDWQPGRKFPLIMMNTNHDALAEWAKTRLYRLDFLVKFRSDSKDDAVLSRILERPNSVFSHFSKIYSELPDSSMLADEDQLTVARKVMLELYDISGRRVPDFFPHTLPENIYDMDAIYCAARLNYGVVKQRRKRGARKLMFNSRPSLYAFKARLPPEVSSFVDDKTLVIEPPSVKAYNAFISSGKSGRKR